ncbi:phosphoribosylanthranilate isomerase [Leptolyngbya cf. ectocarpi LEGE 11479]|uniref:N-(5'-phosphoribosyl)anthranilate isomerase n=1 Tax=Leptolyngbya cf. ectocarpi LEGE 11479 TaxID=1828722 RepID=A0A928X0B2_LEPEC|nr:phosphoribosylanthranilate isomerase [Leptolyngbya ectocarpi]MBE9065164.1 phosphoribosylanthranilate isomerase [Leptolyngbya cf. ectocarpi LEGE 11479]
MRIKICGLTQPDQAVAIATMGASVLGFICVKQSPRYVAPETIQTIVQALPPIDRFGVFANASLEQIKQTVALGQLSGVQLHGQESIAYCQTVRTTLPDVELIKALRIRDLKDLDQVETYAPYVDTFLLDAYHPQHLGGTGHTLDWKTLQTFRPERPWFLAGGLRPDNVAQALSLLSPDGIDLSSGVEQSPGDKNLIKVAQLLQAVKKGETLSL